MKTMIIEIIKRKHFSVAIVSHQIIHSSEKNFLILGKLCKLKYGVRDPLPLC